MSFIRVRSTTGAAHEFDAPTALVAARPGLYVVLDPEPVSVSRPVKYVDSTPTPAAPARKPASNKPARTKRASTKKE